MERRFREMRHEIEEESFMKLAGFKGHLMEDGINSIKLLIKRELVKDGGISGVIVIETSLL